MKFRNEYSVYIFLLFKYFFDKIYITLKVNLAKDPNFSKEYVTFRK